MSLYICANVIEVGSGERGASFAMHADDDDTAEEIVERAGPLTMRYARYGAKRGTTLMFVVNAVEDRDSGGRRGVAWQAVEVQRTLMPEEIGKFWTLLLHVLIPIALDPAARAPEIQAKANALMGKLH